VSPLRALFQHHLFAVIGLLAGVVFALLILRMGFLAAFFLLLMGAFGLWVGRQFDPDAAGEIQDVFERLFGRRERD
jgi:uncharacterized membrane protein